jgi:hypothetical protein
MKSVENEWEQTAMKMQLLQLRLKTTADLTETMVNAGTGKQLSAY